MLTTIVVRMIIGCLIYFNLVFNFYSGINIFSNSPCVVNLSSHGSEFQMYFLHITPEGKEDWLYQSNSLICGFIYLPFTVVCCHNNFILYYPRSHQKFIWHRYTLPGQKCLPNILTLMNASHRPISTYQGQLPLE